MVTYAEKIEYKPVVDLSKIDRSCWIDYNYGLIQNALHKYYCTGDAEAFANQRIYTAHYDLLYYKFRLKEDSHEVAVELTVSLISKIFTNIIDRGFMINPVAYRSYIDSSMKFCLIDYIRSKAKKPMIMLYGDPTIALISGSKDDNSYVETLAGYTEFDPEEVFFTKDLDLHVLKLIKSTLDLMMVKRGSGSLLYFTYLYYINRNNVIFKRMPDYYVDKIMTAIRMVDVVLPLNQYMLMKDRKDKFDAKS